MPIPATTGQLRTNITDMEIGDYIVIGKDSTGKLYVGKSPIGTELPLEGVSGTSLLNNKYFYGVKIAKGLIVYDRVILNSISWDTINLWKEIQGHKMLMNKNSAMIDYQKTSIGDSFMAENEYIALTNSSTWQGANLIISDDSYSVIASGTVEIEYDAFLTGFYNTAPNHILHLIYPTETYDRESSYGIHGYTTNPVRLSYNNGQPSQNVWHKIKHILNFSTRTHETYVDGVLFNVTNATFDPINVGRKLHILIGVGTYSYASKNRYKNITIKNSGQEAKIVKFGEKEGLIRLISGGVAYSYPDGSKSLTSGVGSDFAFPHANEWDSFIQKFPSDKIQVGKTLDDIFHFNIWTWTQDITHLNITTGVSSNSRIVRGKNTANAFGWAYSSSQTADFGFRPVFEYKE
jgi:hypothetical protein